jgi:iron complex outermembrane recepter protein
MARHVHVRVAAFAAALAVLCVGLAFVATAADQSAKHFEIKAQPLEDALAKFSTQSGITVVPTSLTAGKRSAAVHGDMSPNDALAELLRNTGLAFSGAADGSIVIQVSDVSGPPESSINAQSSTGGLEAITVTGSRIVRNGYQAPTPVTVETAEDLSEKAPSDIADALNQLPQFVNSGSPSKSTYVVATSPLAGNFLNLRNLDPNRTLILLDGIRVPATSFDGSVSVDTLPQSLVQRVDVVTGGASAVYGSDAVAGVVNFILDKKFEGVKVTAQTGISGERDDRSDKLSLAVGKSFIDGRLHAIASFDYYNSDGLLNGDRPLGGHGYCQIGSGVASSPFQTLENCRSGFFTAGGTISTAGPLNGYTFLPNGNAVPFNPGGLGGVGAGPYSYLSPPSLGLVASLQTEQGFARVAFDLTPDINLFVQASIGKATNGPQDSGLNNFTAGTPNSIPIYSNNPYLTPSVQAALGTVPAGTPAFLLTRWAYPPYAQAIGKNDFSEEPTEQVSNSYNILVGGEGKFGSTWGWSASYSYGSSTFLSDSYEVNDPRFYAAVNAVRGPNGNIVCQVTLTNPMAYPGCVPMDIFGVGAQSQAALNYVQGTSQWQVVNSINIVDANVHGDAFSLWAGPVSVVAGAEYRDQTLNQTSNSNPATPIDTDGLGLPAAQAATLQHFNIVNVGFAKGSVDVKEAYGEAVVPLAHGLPFAEDLELNLAGRETDYSTSGSVQTWKMGVNYNPITDLRLRGSVSRDIRAPSLYELYAGVQQADVIVTDPHTGVTSTAETQTSGNADLAPEKGLTKSYGFVYQPTWLTGFGLSVDYYDISITDAIITTSLYTNLQTCQASDGTSPACALIIRPYPYSNTTPANFPTKFLTEPLNASSLTEKGIDFELNYRFRADQLIASMPGAFELRGLATYLSSFDTVLAPGQPVQQSAGYFENPKKHGTLSIAYRTQHLDVFLQERFTGSFQMPTYGGEAVYADHGRAPDLAYTDLTITYKPFLDIDLKPFLTINNLFNVQAPLLGASGSNVADLTYPTVKQSYDVVGVYFTLGVKYRF